MAEGFGKLAALGETEDEQDSDAVLDSS